MRDGCFSLSVSWCGTSRSKGAENVKTPPLLFFFTNRQKFMHWYWILIQLQSLSTCWMFLMKQSLQRAWWPHGDTFDIDFKFWRRLWLLKLFVALFIAHLSLLWFIGWLALSFLVWQFVCSFVCPTMVIFLFQIFSSFSLRPPLSSYRCLCVLAVNVCLSSSLQASASIKLLLHYFLLLKKCKSETSSFVPWWSAMFASAAAAQTHVFPATHVCVRRRKKYAAGGQQEKQTQIQIQV